MRRRFGRRERIALRLVSGNRCDICGEVLGDDFHADHQIPFSKGGQTDVLNGLALCPECNTRKSDHVEAVFSSP